MIEVDNLTKQYGMIRALDDITFRVEQGEILGFLGPNGAGKTTTMRILTGLVLPSSGKARIHGIDIFDNPIAVRRQIGYLPESVPIYKDLHVDDYLRYVSALKGVERKQRSRHVDETIQKCGLKQVKQRLIGKLSKGYRQRVGLAQALIGDPEVLILDEPTEGLDPKQIIEIRQLIRELSGHCTILLSTHILPEVSMVCERVIIMNKGKLIAVDTPENLNKNLQTRRNINLTVKGSGDRAVLVLQGIDGVLNATLIPGQDTEESQITVETDPERDIRGDIARRIVEDNFELVELKSASLSLEEIFVQLVTQEEVQQ